MIFLKTNKEIIIAYYRYIRSFNNISYKEICSAFQDSDIFKILTNIPTNPRLFRVFLIKFPASNIYSFIYEKCGIYYRHLENDYSLKYIIDDPATKKTLKEFTRANISLD